MLVIIEKLNVRIKMELNANFKSKIVEFENSVTQLQTNTILKDYKRNFSKKDISLKRHIKYDIESLNTHQPYFLLSKTTFYISRQKLKLKSYRTLQSAD